MRRKHETTQPQTGGPALPTPVLLSWSGGKDSAAALWRLRADRSVEVRALLTTLTEDDDRATLQRVRGDLIRAQAQAAALPLIEVAIPRPCPDELYGRRMAGVLVDPLLRDVHDVAFGDLYLEEVRAYRESRTVAAGMSARFPLWGRDTRALALELIDAGFEAIILSVDPSALDASFAGRRFDRALLDDLPVSVDPCGEGGEFHTFVHAAPVFDHPIPIMRGPVFQTDGIVVADLTLA